jgi:serine kinase of HPr protein (carbohydrate metabolism regulator)
VIVTSNQTIHATAVLVGSRALLIRGASGSGKTTLALRLIAASEQGLLPFGRLVADDRVYLDVAGDLRAFATSLTSSAPSSAGLRISHHPMRNACQRQP